MHVVKLAPDHNEEDSIGADIAVQLSVVAPAYNEEGSIYAAVTEVRATVFTAVPRSELIVVDDGSRDATGAILDRLASHDPRIMVLHQSNQGHGHALMNGLAAASGKFFLLIDSDRQIPMEAFSMLWNVIDKADAVFGVRAVRHDPFARRFISRGLRLVLRAAAGVSILDANVPFKLVRREVWDAARQVIPQGALIPSVFLAIFAIRRQWRVKEIVIPHRERMAGECSIKHWKLARFCWHAFREVLRFCKRL